MRSIVAVVVLVGTAAAIAVAVPNAATGTPAPGVKCARHFSYERIIRHTREMVVYGVYYQVENGFEQQVYACRRPAGRSVPLAFVGYDDDVGGAFGELGQIRVAGTYVLAPDRVGAAAARACAKEQPASTCAPPRLIFSVADVVSRRAGIVVELRRAPANWRDAPVALSPAGLVAWVDTGVLRVTRVAAYRRRGLSGTQVRVLDHGPRLTHLRFRGRHLTWWRDGRAHSADL